VPTNHDDVGQRFRRPEGRCTDWPALALNELVSVPPLSYPRETFARDEAFWTELSRAGLVLLRKEVIQPHLPVRLPCYDFVPIANPTFDGSLPTRGLGHRLRVLPTFVT
jgi:hypothetical protein